MVIIEYDIITSGSFLGWTIGEKILHRQPWGIYARFSYLDGSVIRMNTHLMDID